jgi:hypothetical protein
LGLSLFTFPAKNAMSTVITCETWTTDLLGRPESFLDRRTLPGASAKRRFEEMTKAIVV